MSKVPEGVGLDPADWDKDFPNKPEPSDDDTFENLYACGLAPPEDGEDWGPWQAWLANTHPEAGQVQKGQGYGGLLKDGKAKDGQQRVDEEAGEEPDAGRNG